MEKTIYQELGVLGVIFKYMDRYPVLSNIILWLEALALAWAIWSYEFTIPAYK